MMLQVAKVLFVFVLVGLIFFVVVLSSFVHSDMQAWCLTCLVTDGNRLRVLAVFRNIPGIIFSLR